MTPTAIPTEKMPWFDALILDGGGHAEAEKKYCVMEAVAYIAGEPHSDHPQCACPVVASLLRAWNDSLPDADRARLLKPIVPRLVGTKASSRVERIRSILALDWLIREHTPAWLELREDLRPHAAELRALPPIDSIEAARVAGPKVRAAGDAAGDAAKDAAWAAAKDAAKAAAWDAAWDAAADVTEDAAWAAAADVTEAAAKAAWDAAKAAAWAAAKDAAEAAAKAAWDAVKAAAADVTEEAAREHLRPTVERLQQSALALVERMIAVTE